MKVSLITGSRRWPRAMRNPIHAALAGTELLIVGDAPGVDSLAIDWAIANDCIAHVYCADHRRFALLNGIPGVYVEQAADWRTQKKAAGNIRNARMVKAAFDAQTQLDCKVICYAFPLPDSVGTLDCMAQASGAGLEVVPCHPGVEP